MNESTGDDLVSPLMAEAIVWITLLHFGEPDDRALNDLVVNAWAEWNTDPEHLMEFDRALLTWEWMSRHARRQVVANNSPDIARTSSSASKFPSNVVAFNPRRREERLSDADLQELLLNLSPVRTMPLKPLWSWSTEERDELLSVISPIWGLYAEDVNMAPLHEAELDELLSDLSPTTTTRKIFARLRQE